MLISKTVLMQELAVLQSSGGRETTWTIKGILHLPTGDIELTKVVNVDILRDYSNKTADIIFIEFSMLKGDYIKDLYTNRANLELSIKVIPVPANNKIIRVTRYKAVFINKENPTATGSDVNSLSKTDLNIQGMVTVHLQLIDRVAEPLRVKVVGGIYKNVSVEQALKGVLGGEGVKIIVDGAPGLEALNIVAPDNSVIKKHIIIPHGTLLLDTPMWVHRHMGGVYNSDIGTYLQSYNNRNTLFVFPLFNTKRFNMPDPNAVFFIAPTKQAAGIDKSYHVSNGTTYILAAGEKKYNDDGEGAYMEEGVGFRLSDARAYMKKPVELSKDGPVGNRSRLNTEVAVMDRLDGLNYLPISSAEISSNPFIEYSRVQKRNGGKMDLVWENANPDLLYPGMPCKVAFLEGDRLIEINGVVLGVHALVQPATGRHLESTYRTHCAVSLFVDKV